MKKSNQLLYRCMALLFAAIFLVGFAPKSEAALDQPLVMGDVNLNGHVDSGDASIILKYAVEAYDLNLYNRLAADINGDGKVDVGDASVILRIVTGVIEPYDNAPELIGNVLDPISYEELSYDAELENNEFNYVALCEYTAMAIYEPSDDVAFGAGYTVHLNEGERLTLETTAIYEQLDTTLYLFDNDLNLLVRDDDGGDAYFSRITYTAEKTADHKILVCGYDEESVGEFNLFMSVKPAPVQPDIPDDSDDKVNQSVSFTNVSVPENGKILQYGQSHSVKGTILSSEPIVTVHATVRDNTTSTIELIAVSKFSESSDVHTVNLSDGSNSIDSQLQFANLSFGPKTITIYCETAKNGDGVIFTGEFFMGATMSLLNNNGIANGSNPMTDAQKQTTLDFLNALDPSDLGSKAVMNGFTLLGIKYGTGTGQLDCSAFVRAAYSKCDVQLPRIASEQGRTCFELNGELSLDELRPGDLVFFTDKNCNSAGCSRFRQIHHVSMYMGTIDGVRYYIESAYSLGRVVLRFAWGETEGTRWKINFYGRPYEMD